MPRDDKTDDEGKWVYLRGGRIYDIDSEDRLQVLPLYVITERQHERFRSLQDSFRREKV